MIPVLALLLAPPAQSKADMIRDARSLAKAASAFAEKNADNKLMFMQHRENSERWDPMPHQDAHLDADGMWAAGDVAYVWRQKGTIWFVSVTSGSASGDWSANAEYVFRPDGTLARVEARYAAFSPVEGVVVRERIFDKTGKLVHEGVKCTTLGEPIKLVTGTSAAEMKANAPKVPNYLTASKLPYYSLINSAAR